MCPFLLRIFLDVNRLKKVLDKFKIMWYNLVTRLRKSTKRKEVTKMKIIVGYTGYNEKEIEIDDKFAPAATQDCDDVELWDNFYEEVLRKIGEIVDYDEICSIENPDNGYYVKI